MTQVVAAVIVRNGRILVCQRAAHSSHPGQWEFPGGKVEPGERPEEALRRELREELDIDAVIGDEIRTTRFCYPEGTPFELTFFRVARIRGKPRNRVFASIRWVATGSLGRLDFLDADREMVHEIDRSDLARTAALGDG